MTGNPGTKLELWICGTVRAIVVHNVEIKCFIFLSCLLNYRGATMGGEGLGTRLELWYNSCNCGAIQISPSDANYLRLLGGKINQDLFMCVCPGGHYL